MTVKFQYHLDFIGTYFCSFVYVLSVADSALKWWSLVIVTGCMACEAKNTYHWALYRKYLPIPDRELIIN